MIGTIAIFLGAEPFIESLEHVSVEIGVSPIILSVVISPIAGEMKKISLILLARKGAGDIDCNCQRNWIKDLKQYIIACICGIWSHLSQWSGCFYRSNRYFITSNDISNSSYVYCSWIII